MPTQRTLLGWRGEDAALAYLEKKGWKLLQRHFRTRQGEIDLVMREGKTLVFIEVKTRLSHAFGAPEESVTGQKLERMQAAAETYLARHPWNGPVRMDVVILDQGNIRYLRGV